MSHYLQLLRDILTRLFRFGGHFLQEIDIFENFGGHYCPHSGQFWGSLEAKRGQNAHFCAPGKTLQTVKSMSGKNGFNGFSSFFRTHASLYMVMFDVKGKRESEFWRESGGLSSPQKLLGL